MSALRSYEIKGRDPGPRLLITAGVHGDEFEPIIAAHLLKQTIEPLITAGTVEVVPVVNESAYQSASRCGTDGMDLARVCPGNVNGSVTEQYAFEISRMIRECDFLIDLHNGGKLFDIYPLAGYMIHYSPAVLQKQREMARAFNLSVVWGTEASPQGRTLSVARDAHVPAIYIEYGGGSVFDHAAVKKIVTGCVNVLNYLGMTVQKNKPESEVLHIVEDDSPGGGHLQVKMPSPATGIFISVVRPGAFVKKGDKWGEVYSLQQGTLTTAFADETGIVLFIRIFPRVDEGESLGGILALKSTGI